MAFALEEGWIKGAVLTGQGGDGDQGVGGNQGVGNGGGVGGGQGDDRAGYAPEPLVVKDPRQVFAQAGSKYVAAATVARVNQALKEGMKNLGVAALPCQVSALRNLEQVDGFEFPLIMGLFCTWALELRPFLRFLKENGLKNPQRQDISPPPEAFFEMEEKGTKKRVDLDLLRPLVLSGCRVCPDLPAWQADLSVGALEGESGWNLVVIRSEKGEKLVREALSREVLVAREVPAESLEHLTWACRNKAMRAKEGVKAYGLD
jgi:coenzyme F420 hydrogenase subunit beta